MKIQRIGNEREGAFIIPQEGGSKAEMTFAVVGNEMIINHTEVRKPLDGKGVGSDLVKAGVEYARKHNLKIRPVCSFARKVIVSTPEFSDIL